MKLIRQATLASLALAASLHAQAVSINTVSPEGEVAQVRQFVLRFSEAVVPLGDAQQPAPVTVQCEGTDASPKGQGRWLSEREWVFELERALPPGASCKMALRSEFRSDMTWTGKREFAFQVAAPRVISTQPNRYNHVEEEQQFLLRFSAVPAAASLNGRLWCESKGLGERVPAIIQPTARRDELLTALRLKSVAPAEEWLLLGCQRPMPAGKEMAVVLDPGISAAANTKVGTRAPQRLSFQVREPLTAEFHCERERAEAPCVPLLPLWLSFSEPIPREQLQQIRLKPQSSGGGVEVAPKFSDEEAKQDMVSRVSFPAPLPENISYQLTLPATLRDASGRALTNAASFPMSVRLGAAPPIAKFSTGTFGILEREPEGPAFVPLALRHVQGDLAPQAASGSLRTRRYDMTDAELLAGYARVRKLSYEAWESREQRMLDASDRRIDLPDLKDVKGGGKPLELIGVPIKEPGYHVLELESQQLGASLLAKPAPMFVRTGVLVTNLGVHFKTGNTSSLAWVTTLDRSKPVAQATVTVMSCRGEQLWQGRTDAQGLARIDKELVDPMANRACPADSGFFVTARKDGELAFLFSSWQRGIESWRFNQPKAWSRDTTVRAHTVLDRSLLRAGETVSMKHFFRVETPQGLGFAKSDALPDTLRIVHQGSGQEFTQELKWQGGGRFAESNWKIPATAKLGVYTVELRRGDKTWFTGQFNVEEFKIPLVDARLAAPAAMPVAGGAFTLGAQLNYQSGGPMKNAPLQWSALLTPREPGFTGLNDYSFSPPRVQSQGDAPDMSGDEDGEVAQQNNQRDARLVVDKQSARTDGQGAAKLAVPAIKNLSKPAELLTELSYTDPNGEVQTVSLRKYLWPAKVMPGLRASSWTANGQALHVDGIAVDTNGKPVAGQKIAIRGRLQQWISTRKRMVGGFYAYDNRTETKELGELCSGTTDDKGRMSCEVSLSTPGSVDLIATTKDSEGHLAEAASTVWVTRQGEFWFAQDNDDRMDVIPEKRSYAPGETARLQVRMPFREAEALLTIEREGVSEARVISIKGSDPYIDLKVEKGWSPNVYVSVLALRGRVRDVPWYSFFTWGWKSPVQWWKEWRGSKDYQPPTAMVDLGKPAFKLGVTSFEVGRDRFKLDVAVTPDAPRYGIRQTVRTKVRVTQEGKPVPEAEIAFAAVDEGLLALRSNDSWQLMQALIQNRPWAVETATAQSEIIGRRHYGRKAIAAGGGGGKSARELFDTLLLWRGQVKLDANGEATIEVPLNDSLTSFRLVAIADADTQRFGTGFATVQVSQDLQMLSGLPLMVREGDRLQAAMTIRNASNRSMKLGVSLSAQAVMEDGKRQPLTLGPQSVQLAAGDAKELSWPVDVPLGATSIEWSGETSEQGGSAKDALKITQQVQPAVPLTVQQSLLRQLDGPQSIPVAAPANALPPTGIKRGGLQLTLQPKLAGTMPGVRRFFEQYPYICLEQQTSKAIGLHDAALWKAMTDKLPTYLDSDGLANYYPPRAGDPPYGSDVLTSYILAASNEAGRELPQASREAMLGGLQAFLEGRLQRRYWSPREDQVARRIAALEAMSRYGRASAKLLATIDARAIDSWPTGALIDWLSLHRRMSDAPERAARIQEAQAKLRARLTWAGSTLTFANEANDFWWWLMVSGDANAGRLILATLEDAGWASDMPRLVLGMMARQNRGAWLTTTANVWNQLAVEKFSARFESTPVAGRSIATLAGKEQSIDWAKQRDGGQLMLPWPEAPAPLSLVQQGTGKPWYSAQVLAAVPRKEALQSGYRVTRSVTAVERKDPSKWSRGDVLRVRVEVESTSDMSWVVVSDPVPPGAMILGGGSERDSAIATQGEARDTGGWVAYEERAAAAWRLYFAYLPAGKHRLEYTIRLNAAGSFQMPGSRVEAMYSPDRAGELPVSTMDVAP
ncbi:alpha-2-macroglobulin [Burkholderiaceae bacterium UC74_6]